MSEDTPQYNKKKKKIDKHREDIKFVRLRNTQEDLVGYVEYKPECVLITHPLRIDIETIFEEGRQILSLQEYLPQSVVEIKEVEILTEDIMFITPVREDFVEQYEYVADFFYNNSSKIKTQTKEEVNKEIMDKTQKVVSILEAMANKKDKPVH